MTEFVMTLIIALIFFAVFWIADWGCNLQSPKRGQQCTVDLYERIAGVKQ